MDRIAVGFVEFLDVKHRGDDVVDRVIYPEVMSYLLRVMYYYVLPS